MPDITLLSNVTEGLRQAVAACQEKYSKQTQSDVKEQKNAAASEEKARYEIKVYTGDLFGASTRANVFCVLYGQGDKNSGMIKLCDETAAKKKEAGAYFQRAEVDTFVFECQNLGPLEKIRIGHDNTGSFPSWFLSRVEVTETMGGQSFGFLCGRWLATTQDDGQIIRDLPVEHQFQLCPQDFTDSAAVEFTLPSGCMVKEYSPKVFLNMRELYGIHTADYCKSWTLPDEKLVAKEGAGRSGSLFLMSDDKKYMLKTIPQTEVRTFATVLPAYYSHVVEQRDTLIMKVFGLMRFKFNGMTLYAIIFNNVLYNPISGIAAKYDLKGRVPKPGKALQNTEKAGTDYVFKDKDLDRKFYICEEEKVGFLTRLSNDIGFFAANNLMDYSLLIGVTTPVLEDEKDFDRPMWLYTKNSAPEKEEAYQIGFIDCLTSYGFRKKTANAFKSALWTQDQLSTINAPAYADRIKKYLFEIFDSSAGTASPKPAVRRLVSSEVGGGSTDNLLLSKKVELLEATVVKMESRVQTLEAVLNRLLVEQGDKPISRNPSFGSNLAYTPTFLQVNSSIDIDQLSTFASTSTPHQEKGTSTLSIRSNQSDSSEQTIGGNENPQSAVISGGVNGSSAKVEGKTPELVVNGGDDARAVAGAS
eukprot:comp20595_c1_seq1/m.26535 comp20595_c1_seq1/g.26535  ORF comp20595_c1_seq1/g.26535 comp20595_c1_seq1/m.26535 type:complete len:643 (-) comp20595_c1_seq1:169-2097(-)